MPNASIATPAGILAITVPLAVMPETATLKNVLSPLSKTVAVVAPAVPLKVTSPVSKTGDWSTEYDREDDRRSVGRVRLLFSLVDRN